MSSYPIVWVKVKGFKENPMAMGTVAKAGDGNWHLFVDGRLAAVSVSSVADVRLARGTRSGRLSTTMIIRS